jgi:SAM-dependent methyltransferase
VTASPLWRYLYGQFGNPHGMMGHVAGWMMASRRGNVARNLWAVELLGVGPDDSVLEIGCGPGVALSACIERATRGLVVGVDRSPVMIAQAARRNRVAVAEGRAALYLGRIDRAPLAPSHFDRLLSVNAIQFAGDPGAVVARWRDLLCPGGRMAIAFEPRGAGRSADKAEAMSATLARAMLEAGMTGVREDMLPMDRVPAICVLGTRAATEAPPPPAA